MAYATRINSSGNLYTNGTLDELSIGVGSINLDGTSSYLSTTSMPAPGSGSITYECWFNTTTVGARVQTILNNRSGNTSDGLDILVSSAKINVTNSGGVKYSGGTTTLVANTWYHLAVVRTGASNFVVYVNGVQDGTFTDTTNITSTTFTVGFTPTGTAYFSGYISNVRIAYEAVYSAAFTPSQSLLPATANTKLLLNVLNSTAFINDNSTSKLTLTNNGSAAWIATGPFNRGVTSLKQRQINDGSLQVASTFDEVTNNPAALGSLQFDGSTGYLQGTVSSPSTNDFTIEGWVYFKAFTQVTATPFSILAGGSSSGFEVYYNGTGWGVRNNTANFFSPAATTYAIIPYSWYHVAFVRASGVFTLYINGVSIATSSTARTTTDTTLSIGSWVATGTTFFNGYISNVRYVNGTAVYTANFTPSVLPLTAITNTAFLLNTPNTNSAFKDSSVNNVTMTTIGSVTSIFQTPFNPAGYYNYYFNSADPDYLTIAASTAYNISTGDYTIECWAYGISTGASQQGIFTLTGATSSGAGGISVYVNTSNSISFFVNGNGSGKVQTSAAQKFLPSVWNHVALVGSGGTNTLYVNGASVASNALTPTVSNVPVNIGRQYGDNTAQTWNGYISNFRVVIGTALYTGAFTPPTAPLTAITNTKVLSCQSNKIVDNSTIGATFTITGNTAVNSNTSPFTTYNYAGSGVAVQRLSSTGNLQITGIFDEYTKPA